MPGWPGPGLRIAGKASASRANNAVGRAETTACAMPRRLPLARWVWKAWRCTRATLSREMTGDSSPKRPP